MDKVIRLDAHTTPRICSPAIERLRSALEETVPLRLEPAIASLYDLVKADATDRFIFTADPVWHVLWSVFLEVSRKSGKCHFVAYRCDEPSTLQMLNRLEELGCYVKFAANLDELCSLVSVRTALVLAPFAHGLSGELEPIEEISLVAKEKGALLHVDARYAVGKSYLSFHESAIDYLTFSGDLVHGPKCGALFAKKEAPLAAHITDGLDAPSLLSLGAAAMQSLLCLDSMNLETARLRDLLESEIKARVAAEPLFVQNRLPNVSAIRFAGAHQDAMLYFLNQAGIAAAVLKDPQENSMSFVLSRMTTEPEVRKAASIIAACAEKLSHIAEGV